MSGYTHGVLLAINKDTSELHHEWVEYNDVYYHGLKQKARIISESTEPPLRISNSPLFITCKMCNFRNVCHDRNS